MVITDWNYCEAVSLFSEIPKGYYDIALSHVHAIDDREDMMSELVEHASKESINVSYVHERSYLSLNNENIPLRKLSTIGFPGKKVLVDATRLSVPELLHVFCILKDSRAQFDVLYVQPEKYKKKGAQGNTKSGTEESYDLSNDGAGVQQLPPFVSCVTDVSLVANLGFEGHRLGSVLQSEQYPLNSLTCLLGTPAFKAGWENITLKNNISIVSELSSNVRVKIAGANDPIRTHAMIKEVYEGSNYEDKKLCLVPIGTKPMSIASAWFAADHRDVIVVHDFVEKRQKRSSGTDTAHLWKFST